MNCFKYKNQVFNDYEILTKLKEERKNFWFNLTKTGLGLLLPTTREDLLNEGSKRFGIERGKDNSNIIYQDFKNTNFRGGFSTEGRGTYEGDGKDKQMRKESVGFIGELNPNKSDRYESSTYGSFKHFKNNSIEEERYLENVPEDTTNGNKIMLALNGSINDTDILQKTKNKILELHNKGFEFLVGDMPGSENRIGDDNFITYLKSIGANFTVFGVGNNSRILYQVLQEEEKIKYQSFNPTYTGDLAIEEKLAELMENTPDEFIANTKLERFIQWLKNLFRNMIYEKNHIDRFLRDLNQGRVRDNDVKTTENKKTDIIKPNLSNLENITNLDEKSNLNTNKIDC